MKKAMFTVFLVLLSILLVACSEPCLEPKIMVEDVCCMDENNNQICDNETSEVAYFAQLETEAILDDYLNYLSHKNIGESVYNLGKQIPLTDKSFKEYLIQNKLSASKTEDEYDLFKEKCYNISMKENCDFFVNEFNKKLADTYFQETTIKGKEFSVVDNTVEWTVSRNDVTSTIDESEFRTVKYIFEKFDNEWRITDFLTDQGVLISVLNITSDDYMKEVTDIFDGYMNIAVRAKEDTCWLAVYTFEDKKLTYTEAENEMNICYNRFIDPARENKDTSYCDKMFEHSSAGRCYGEVAIVAKEQSACDNITPREYEAKGYLGMLSDKDVCYYTYAWYDAGACYDIANEDLKNTCIDVYW